MRVGLPVHVSPTATGSRSEKRPARLNCSLDPGICDSFGPTRTLFSVECATRNVKMFRRPEMEIISNALDKPMTEIMRHIQYRKLVRFGIDAAGVFTVIDSIVGFKAEIEPDGHGKRESDLLNGERERGGRSVWMKLEDSHDGKAKAQMETNSRRLTMIEWKDAGMNKGM